MDKLDRNNFSSLQSGTIAINEDLVIHDFLVKAKENYLEVISIMTSKTQNNDIHSYHYFGIDLDTKDMSKEEVLEKLKGMYLDNSLELEGCSVSGTKEEILEDIIDNFPLDTDALMCF